jgi:hypothetical protein
MLLLELNLQNDIMPYFVSFVPLEKQLAGAKTGKKQKKWGRVQPVRQSTRNDRSKNIIEKAEERKKIIILEKPKMIGIMSSNLFSILPVHELDAMADQFGVDIIDHTNSSS